MGAPLILPLPLPGRDIFAGKVGLNTDQNTGIGQPWIRWFTSIYNTLISFAAAIVAITPISSTQAGLAGLTPQNGQLVYVSDFNHVLRFDSTTGMYSWAPGENGSGYISAFLNDPSPTTGWQLCDGSATTKLNSDGTVTPVVVPNYATASYLKLGSAAPVPGPTAPSGITSANSTTVVVAAGAGTTVAANGHTHTPATIELERTQLKGWYRR